MTFVFAAIAFVGVAAADTSSKDSKKALYKDPVTGEMKEAKKMPSQMSDAEKASLSNEEYKALKDLEMEVEVVEADDSDSE